MKLSDIKPNPNNPRLIKDHKFKQLVQSIKDFPEMMAKRPMVCVTDTDNKLYPLGGNMRLRAIQEIGIKDIPDEWVVLADEWTEEKRREFIIKDNVSFGTHDWDVLANEWDAEQLADWGLDVPGFDEAEEKDMTDLSDELKETFEVIISCKDEKHQEQVYNKMIGDGYECRVLTL